MRGLFLKIFVIFWLAQTLIFGISVALIVRQRFPGPGIVSDALDSNLKHDAEVALRVWNSGGCAAFADNTARHEPSGSALLDPSGKLLCRTANAPSLDDLVPQFPERVDGRQLNSHYVWLVPVAANGAKYEYVWFQPPSTRPAPQRRWNWFHYSFPQLPVTIAVDGVTTFILVLLFSRPLVRLRKAARELAAGNLSARVEEAASKGSGKHADEFQALAHDFNHMADRLESLVGAQRLLLRDVSHELRSPLARLSVALELAHEDAEPALDQHLGRIEREAERLNQLIGQLLTLSSLETRERTSTFRPVSLNLLCEQIVPDAEYEAQQHSCSVMLEETSDCSVFGDRELLYRAIENVVRNAIRYTEPNTEVTISVGETVVEGKRSARIEVSDRGPGIPDAELAHIFRPFYRVDQARSSNTGGSGVGLAITERAVRLHGGTVRATNRTGGGTSIQMVFPVSVEA
ncbi:MAG TPA: ATP-binding protein [Acidobacteriaceae bacterium]|jgi:two-component system sensor histidine kinase CpxA